MLYSVVSFSNAFKLLIYCLFRSRSFRMVRGRPTKAKGKQSPQSSQYWFNTKVIVTGLVSATVTEATTKKWRQLIDKVGAAVLYMNVQRIVATISGFKLSNADFL